MKISIQLNILEHAKLLKSVIVTCACNMEPKQLVFIFLHALQWYNTAMASGLIEMSVPALKQESDNATLRCMYNLGTSTTLYSIKWYKNDYEFYRYLPRDSPKKQSFHLLGVLVNLEDSDEYQVSLQDLSLSSTGLYTCEVSTEAPVFHTITAKAPMTIIALPKEPPKMIGLQDFYNDGDLIDVNCTSSPSLPIAQLVWYVNGEKANSSWVTTFAPTPYLDTGRKTITINMRTNAGHDLFPSRVLSLRCVGSLAQRSWQDQKWTSLLQLSNGAVMLNPHCQLRLGSLAISVPSTYRAMMQLISVLVATYLPLA